MDNHYFSAAHLAWTDRKVERYNLEIIRTAKAISSETEREAGVWVKVVTVVEWALNSACSERIRPVRST